MGASSIEKVQKIPSGIAPEDRAERLRIFNEMDVNGNGYLSLAEVDKGIRDVLNLPQLFETKPVLIRAFNASKGKCKGKKELSDDYVTKSEFRYLLISLKLYYYLWLKFDAVDLNQDRRISEKQFLAGQDFIREWGIRIQDPKKQFETLLKKYNAQANITFTQFCEWAIVQHLDEHPDSLNQNEID